MSGRGRISKIGSGGGGFAEGVETRTSRADDIAGVEAASAADAAVPPSVPAEDDAAGVDAAAGGIIRMPARHSSRIGAPPEEAA